MQIEHSIEKALKNIIHFGDTDIFPFPFERYLFEDKFEECKSILESIHKDFEKRVLNTPPLIITKLNQVGYFGFRKVTQIEPFWNAYFLACVIGIADKIEKSRIPVEENTIFSYRYQWQPKKFSLFNDITWNDYRINCLAHSRQFKYVIQTDISDFYSRINHHKLENELNTVAKGHVLVERIKELLKIFSGSYSYGLPIGGPAARILSELTLNHIDQHLRTRDITFCRYADDFTLFADTEQDAYNSLIFLAEKLSNEGLSLQKTKTKIILSKEFDEMHAFLDPLATTSPTADDEQKLLNISISFDPYSDNAEEDYLALKKAVRSIDIISILSREVNKTRIDQTVSKQAINAIKVLSPELQHQAIRILLDSENLVSLAPVFTTIMKAVRSVYNDLSIEGKDLVDKSLLELFKTDNHLTSIELNVNFIVQVLAIRCSKPKEKLLIKLFDKSRNIDHGLNRQIIVTLAHWNSRFWLSDIRKHFTAFTTWERRAFVYASYFLDDEGRHWRQNNKSSLTEIEQLIMEWSNERVQKKNFILV
jgi:hypothetical protein